MKLSDISTWDIPDEIHNAFSALLSENETLKKKVAVAVEGEQNCRVELNGTSGKIAQLEAVNLQLHMDFAAASHDLKIVTDKYQQALKTIDELNQAAIDNGDF